MVTGLGTKDGGSSGMPSWLFHRFIVRRFIKNPIRATLLVLAVAVATTLMVSVARVSFSSVKTFEDSLGYGSSEYPLSITPVGGRISTQELGRCLAPLASAFAVVGYRREFGEVVTSTGREGIRVVGVTGFGDVGEGELSGDAVYATRGTIQRYGLTNGEPVMITGDGFSVRALVKQVDRTRELAGNAALVPLSFLGAGNSRGVLDGILLHPLRPTTELSSLREVVSKIVNGCSALRTPVRVETVQGSVARSERLLAAYRFNVGVMALMTALVCVLLVSQATQVSARNISRELAVLRTLGVGRLAGILALTKEAAVVGLSGALLGITVGEPLVVALTELLLSTARDIYNVDLGAAEVAPRYMVAVVGAMVLVVVGGAVLGAVGVVRVSPSIGTRTGGSVSRPFPLKPVVMVAILSVALLLAIQGALSYAPLIGLAYLYIGGCIVMVAGLVPMVLSVTPRMVRFLPGGVASWIARGGVYVGARGYVLGATGATLAVSLICALTLMVDSFRGTLLGWSKVRLRGDLFVSSSLSGKEHESRLSDDMVSLTRAIPGVKRVLPYFEARTVVSGSELVVGASDLRSQVERGIFIPLRGEIRAQKLHEGSEVLLSEAGARKLRLAPGDRIAIEGRNFRIGAIIQEFGTELPLIQVDERVFRELYPLHSAQSLTIDLTTPSVIESVRREVERVVGARGITRDNGELRALVVDLFEQTFQVTNSIRWIVFSLGVMGILLAVLQHLWERRRELKTLHLLGMSPAELVTSVVYESVLVSGLPVGVGIVGGIAMGWGLTHYINPLSFGWSLTFSLSFFPIVVSILFVGTVAVVVGLSTFLLLPGTIKRATFADE